MKFRWETEFKETEIGEIPVDWEVKELGQIVQIVQGKNLSTLKLKESGYPVFGANGIIGYFDKYHYEEPQVLIACRGSTCGIINWSLPYSYVNNNAMALLPKEKINKTFLYFIMSEFYNNGLIESAITGTGQPQITKETLNPFSVPYPPLPEQNRIATVLSWFDDLIENKKRQNEILEKTAMAIFKNWFIDFEPFKDGEFVDSELGKIPKGWEVKRLGEIVKIESGGNAPQEERYFENGYLPFIRVKYLNKGVCISEYDLINDLAVKDYNLKLYPQGSIVFQRSGESLKEARINFLPFDAYVVNHLSVIDARKVIDLYYIFCYLKFCLSDIIESAYAGTSLPYLRTSDIENFRILLPKDNLILSFHSLVEPLFQKIILNQKQIMLLRKIRDKLLPLLVFGKLRVEEV
ncbi:MAG: restriction endonuclease subunit S [Candidatus Aenigmatarchaeota archaeon]